MVCHELGFERASAFRAHIADNNDDNGTWWLNNVGCIGSESSIFSCLHDGLKAHSCDSNKKATVVCIGAEGTKKLYLIGHCWLIALLTLYQPSFTASIQNRYAIR